MKRRQLNPLPLLDEKSVFDLLEEYGCNRSHANKLWRAFLETADGELNYSTIPGFPQRLVEPLETRFARITSTVVKTQESAYDGTVKLLVKLQDGHEVETVIIPHFKSTPEFEEDSPSRVTLCVSSQIGCRMACSFCATGTLGHSGDLYAGEILEQLWHARRIRPEISNIVFMGMGEPLENYEAVIAAIRGMSDPFRFNLAPRCITVSTVGVVPNIERLFFDAPAVKLALSLHAPTQEIRELIVPTAKAWPLDKLMTAVDKFMALQSTKTRWRDSDAQPANGSRTKKGMVMMEYVVLKGVNDSQECAHALGNLMKRRKVVVNLIPFNEFEGNKHRTPDDQVVDSFHKTVVSYGVRAYVRMHHGRDIAAACGQLAKIEKDLEDAKGCSDKRHGEMIGEATGVSNTIQGRWSSRMGSSSSLLIGLGALFVTGLAVSVVRAIKTK